MQELFDSVVQALHIYTYIDLMNICECEGVFEAYIHGTPGVEMQRQSQSIDL